MKEEKGRKVYANRWPKVLDLEELVYRPLLLKVLPGLFAGIFKGAIKLTEIIWSFMILVPEKFFKGIIRLTKAVWNGILSFGKGLGFVTSSFGEAIIFSIKKVFFKELVEDRKNPVMENDNQLQKAIEILINNKEE